MRVDNDTSPCIISATASKVTDATSQRDLSDMWLSEAGSCDESLLDATNLDSFLQSVDEGVYSESSIDPTQHSPPVVDKVDESVLLSDPTPRSVYLITYSRADVLKVQSREEFGKLMAEQWPNAVMWTVGTEMHRHEGVHFHCALKLSSPKRWVSRRAAIKEKIGIDVDFLGFHTDYFDAFSYVTKQDSHYKQSPGHIDLGVHAPQTTAASRARNLRAAALPKSTKSARMKKPPRLDNAQVCELIVANSIRTDEQLGAFATKLKREGKDDLRRWFTNHTSKRARCEVIQTAWTLEEAEENLRRESVPRLDLLELTLSDDHRYDADLDKTCKGEWLSAAVEIIQKNGMDVDWFRTLIWKALRHGRSKKNNIMIIGATNHAKSFLFMPLTHIYRCFSCPSDNKFNWVGAPEKEVVFLNDFRYSDSMMPWGIFLNFLEGATVNVSMPKTHYTQDQVWSKKQPIFATSDKRIVRVLNNQVDEGETEQMEKRWQYIQFNYQIPEEKIDYTIVSCPRCFAELILKGAGDLPAAV